MWVVVWACGLALRAWDSLEVVAEELRAEELQAGAGDPFKLGLRPPPLSSCGAVLRLVTVPRAPARRPGLGDYRRLGIIPRGSESRVRGDCSEF